MGSCARQRLKVERVDSIVALAPDSSALETTCGAFLSIDRLSWLERDARWNVSYLAVTTGGILAGVLPLFAAQHERWFDPPYDPAVTDWGGTAATDWLLVGGRTDFACGFLRNKDASPQLVTQAAVAAGEAARVIARDLRRRPAVLFANEHEAEFLTHAVSHRHSRRAISTAAILDVPSSLEEYLISLKSSHRNVVRRDWRDSTQHGVRATCVPWTSVLDEAPEMIASVTRRHGRPEHPELVRYRLEGWLENREITPLAFQVTGDSGPAAICLGWEWRGHLQMHVVGLAAEHTPHRHLAYVESMIYAPLRYGISSGCSEVWLSAGASESKRLRGARFIPLLALLEA